MGNIEEKKDVFYKMTTCTKDEFSSFIKSNYCQFTPKMEDLCENHEYIEKLYTHAMKYELWKDNTLIAVLCAYYNDENHFAYVPYVCVMSNETGKGYATQLFNNLIRDCKNRFNYIGLEVRIKNTKAYNLYSRLGFKEIGRNAETIQMRLNI